MSKKKKARAKMTDSLEKMLARCTPDGDCLIWGGSVDKNGYPRVNVKKEANKVKTLQARRVVWEFRNKKPVPPGMKVTCTCGQRLCLEHLDVIPHREAIARAANMPNSIAKRVANGLKLRVNAKLDMEKARYIRESDKTAVELAKEFGISPSFAARVRNGENWKDYGNPFAGLGGRSA